MGALHCGHEFHTECIDSWLDHSDSCPDCRPYGDYLPD
jgi:hypothetical protein